MSKQTFEEWKAQADRECVRLSGLSLDDLEDAPYARWYEERVAPKTVAKRAIRAAGYTGRLS